jgi:hypothetical protein
VNDNDLSVEAVGLLPIKLVPPTVIAVVQGIRDSVGYPKQHEFKNDMKHKTLSCKLIRKIDRWIIIKSKEKAH